MSLPTAKAVSLLALLILSDYASSLIVPEEVPSALNGAFYSVFPPTKIGTDSRIGIGFRLGEHADFQVLMEYGPQKYTQPIGNAKDNKNKRDAMMAAALKGEFGPWSQAIAKFQLRRKYKKLLEEYKRRSLKSAKANNNDSTKNVDKKVEQES